MKKLLTLALAAAMMAGAAQFALAAEDDGASSIMAQINSFKATNQEKTGGEAAEDKAEAQAPAAEESEAPAQAQPAQQAETPNPAAAAVDQIVREAAQQAAQEAGEDGNNRGVVAVPAQDAAEPYVAVGRLPCGFTKAIVSSDEIRLAPTTDAELVDRELRDTLCEVIAACYTLRLCTELTTSGGSGPSFSIFS